MNFCIHSSDDNIVDFLTEINQQKAWQWPLKKGMYYGMSNGHYYMQEFPFTLIISYRKYKELTNDNRRV